MVTTEMQIKELDKRLKDMEEEMNTLSKTQELLWDKRTKMFYELDLPCKVKYEMAKDGGFFSDTYRIFFEKGELQEEIYNGTVPYENPSQYRMTQVPEKYKYDFLMVWKKIYKERKEKEEEKVKKWSEIFYKKYAGDAHMITDFNKLHMKRFYKILAMSLHPDNKDGDMEAMQYLNYLREELDVKN